MVLESDQFRLLFAPDAGSGGGTGGAEGKGSEELDEAPGSQNFRLSSEGVDDVGSLTTAENPQKSLFPESPLLESAQNPRDVLQSSAGDIKEVRRAVWEVTGYVPPMAGGSERERQTAEENQRRREELERQSDEAWSRFLAAHGYRPEEISARLQRDKEVVQAAVEQSKREREEWNNLSPEEEQRLFEETERKAEELNERLWKAYKRMKRQRGEKIDKQMLADHERLKKRKRK